MKKKILVIALSCLMLISAIGIFSVFAAESKAPELTIYKHNLSFSETIYIMYAVEAQNAKQSDVELLLWTSPQSKYTADNAEVKLSSAGTTTVDGKSCLVFEYRELAARQMTDYVYARAHVEQDGEDYYSEVSKYSILTYAYSKLGKIDPSSATTNAKLKTLLTNMLTYGASAQEYFGYKTSTLAIDNFSYVTVEGGTLPDGFTTGLYKEGSKLVLTANNAPEGHTLYRWQSSDGSYIGSSESIEITVGSNEKYTAIFGPAVPELDEDKAGSSDLDNKDIVTYSYSAGNSLFSLKEADSNGSRVTLRAKTVSALRFGQAFKDNTTATYQAKLQITSTSINSSGNYSPWNAVYLGLRLGSVDADATNQSGIWLAVRENQIGMRTGNWPEGTAYVDSGVDFSKERMIYIEDDMKNDVITVYADNDSGKKVAIAVVKLENGYINLYKPGASNPSISEPIVSGINANGYFSIWLHHMIYPTYVTDLVATGVNGGSNTSLSANTMNSSDVFADTWVSVDDEGRESKTGTGTGSDKKVGIFYFLWHDIYNNGDGPSNGNLPNGEPFNDLIDHSRSYLEGGVAKLNADMNNRRWQGFGQYWAEPYFGYYRSNDEWVIRKHTYQLSAAGVDFIYIDVTNGVTYKDTYMKILEVWTKMRAEGCDTPQIAFNCGIDNAQTSFDQLWNDLYSTGRYEELWFKLDGKPLILIPTSVRLPAAAKNFFTARASWSKTEGGEASWYTNTNGNGCWPWADMYPQGAGKSPTGKIEQMIVMCGFWSNGSYGTNAGRSYNYYTGQPYDGNYGFTLAANGTSGKGIAFQQQFDRALAVDPDIIMITGWNEWWAGIWWDNVGVGQTIANTYTVTSGTGSWTDLNFTDCFSPEFSRDIEPVKGWFNDNYYYQMVQNIREFKGSRKTLTAFGQKAIDVSGTKFQWYSVGPEYRDYAGDIAWRDCWSSVGGIYYKNHTGRNDITTAKVSKNGDDLYFYAECANGITAPTGTNWMNLFINSDCNYDTGWYGYDYVINRSQSGDTCSVSKFNNNSWSMTTIGWAEYSVTGNYIQIKLSASQLGIGNTFDFKWADNSVDDGDIMQFIDLGDAAPNDRFNYRYTTAKTEVATPDVLKDDMIVLKAGSYNAFVGGKMVMLDSASTKAVFLVAEEGLFLPKSFAAEKMGLNVSGCTVYNHYGVEYVEISALLAASGKTVTRSDSLIVISNGTVSEDDMLTLYRALY